MTLIRRPPPSESAVLSDSIAGSHTFLSVLEGLELLLSPDEEESPELDDAEESELSLAGRLGGGEACAACMQWQFPTQSYASNQAFSFTMPAIERSTEDSDSAAAIS